MTVHSLLGTTKSLIGSIWENIETISGLFTLLVDYKTISSSNKNGVFQVLLCNWIGLVTLFINQLLYMKEWNLKYMQTDRQRRAIAEHFYCDNTQSFVVKLEKLIQISVIISVPVRPIQRWEICDKSKIWVRLRTLWMTFVYIFLLTYQ